MEGQSASTSAATSDTSFKVPHWLDRALLALGLVLLAYVIARVPMAELARACIRIGPLIIVTPLVALGWISCNTSALHLLLERRIPWLQLLKIRLVGDGYNALLPLGGLGGEPFKIRHISKYVPADQLLTALIRDRVIENAVGLLFTALCLGSAIRRFVFPASFRVALIAYVAIGGAVGLISGLLVLTKLPNKLGALIRRWLPETGESTAEFGRSRFVPVVLWFVAARFVGCIEIALLLWALGLGFDPLTVLFSYSLLQAAGFVGFAIPAGVGVFEGTAVFLFSILAVSSGLGLAFALARRARMLIVGLFGVLLHLLSKTEFGRGTLALDFATTSRSGAAQDAFH